MHSFHDSAGRVWPVELTVGSAKRIFAECGVDLISSAVGDDVESVVTSSLDALVRQPYLLADVLWSFCSVQARRDHVSREDFLEKLDADAIQNAADAVIGEVILFSRPAKRKIMTALFRNAKAFAGELDRTVSAVLDTPEMRRSIRTLLAKSVSATRESLASTPMDSRSANLTP